MRNIEKMTSKRDRLAYGEVNERRQRNDKLHKPERVSVPWTAGEYDHQLRKKLSRRANAISQKATLED